MWIFHGRIAPVGYLNLSAYFTDVVANWRRLYPGIPLRPVCFNDGTHVFNFSFLPKR